MVSSAKPVSGGEGEEGESILHHARGKVWTIKDGVANELGIAGIWIKERDGVRRLLARNEVTGNVLIVCRPSSPLSIVSTLAIRQEDSQPFCYQIGGIVDSSYHSDNLIQNFRLTPALSVKMEKTFLTFSGYSGMESEIYRIRLKEKVDVEKLKEELEKAAV